MIYGTIAHVQPSMVEDGVFLLYSTKLHTNSKGGFKNSDV